MEEGRRGEETDTASRQYRVSSGRKKVNLGPPTMEERSFYHWRQSRPECLEGQQSKAKMI